MNVADAPRTIHRHRLATRLWHWATAFAVVVLIGSGLTISNAHPQLYWGVYGANFDAPWLQLPRFPGWMTIPSRYNLALARQWHLLSAWILGVGLLLFMIASLWNGHFARKLRLRQRELGWRHIRDDVAAHLSLRFHDPEAPGDYNLFQKLSYIAIIFAALPLAILTGIELSPGMNAAWPWVLDLLGGRASARSIHFVTAAAIAGFVVVHLALVILAGVGNELRAMVTGRWRVPE